LKKIVSILLIVAFALHTTSELWIIVSFQLNREYIAEHLCINRLENIPLCRGACYLQKQFTNNETQQNKLTDLKLKETVWFCEIPAIAVPTPPISYSNTVVYSPAKNEALLPAFLDTPLKPPTKLVFEVIDFA